VPKRFFRMSALMMTLLMSGASQAAVHSVTMKSISYDPKKIEIKKGDSIEWINKSYTEHSATADGSKDAAENFETGLIQPKKNSKKIEFSKPGTYFYHCSVHGKTMSGQVIVAE
jgi:plastocyanin